MENTPKSLRLQIGLFGRTNVGKSSFLNMVLGQDFAITSPVPGTTTDVVEKVMELLPVGPVVFLDTGGIDDASALAHLRIKKTVKIFDRADVFVLIVEPGRSGEFEERIYQEALLRKTPLIIVVNKIDMACPSDDFIRRMGSYSDKIIQVSSTDRSTRDKAVNNFKEQLLSVCPEEFLAPSTIIGDILSPGGIAVLIVPIDLEAPKGRLILPQVQTIRDALDNDGAALVVKESEYVQVLNRLNSPPDIIVCDSQVVRRMVDDTPEDFKCTTFSILFARYKGDLDEFARGAAMMSSLKPGDKVLIAEACSHHAIEDDIGRVKIPRWLSQYAGGHLSIDITAGRDFPENVGDYKLIIQCGSCMLTRRETLFRIQKARRAGVPVTNYGLCISVTQGVLERVLEPFPSALKAFHDARLKRGG
jgi:[FeFe] hydrogenase H-cluster maturation GTPase HydF